MFWFKLILFVASVACLGTMYANGDVGISGIICGLPVMLVSLSLGGRGAGTTPDSGAA